MSKIGCLSCYKVKSEIVKLQLPKSLALNLIYAMLIDTGSWGHQIRILKR